MENKVGDTFASPILALLCFRRLSDAICVVAKKNLTRSLTSLNSTATFDTTWTPFAPFTPDSLEKKIAT